MSDLVKYGAIGIGGYFLLKYFGIDLLAGFTTPAVSTAGTASTPQAADPTNAATAAASATTLAMLQAAMRADKQDPTGLYATDTWNYYYLKVRGLAGPAPEDMFVGVDRSKKYTLNEWWNGMTRMGFSGMGLIAHRVNPYWNPAGGGVGFGAGLTVNGMEKYIIGGR
jgi:hypothetical protein